METYEQAVARVQRDFERQIKNPRTAQRYHAMTHLKSLGNPEAYLTLLSVVLEQQGHTAPKEVQPVVVVQLDKAIQRLDDRKKDILEARYGLKGAVVRLDEVAKHYDMTRRAIRALENEALRSLQLGKPSGRLEQVVGSS